MSKLFAIIEQGVVVNVAVAESSMGANWVDVTELSPQPGIGWAYNGSVFATPIAPVAPPPIVLPQHITLLSLMLRLTEAERTAVRTSTDAQVSDVMFLFEKARYIDLERPETIGGLQLLETKTLLAVGRATAILSAPVLDSERP